MNMKKSFDRIVHEYGHIVYLQRRVLNDPNASHPYFRPSFSTTIEKWRVRQAMAGRKTALTSSAEERPEGIVHSVDQVWYFPSEAVPKEGDRIYTEDPRYIDKQETWIIDYALAFRGRRGKVVYWLAGGTRENPN